MAKKHASIVDKDDLSNAIAAALNKNEDGTKRTFILGEGDSLTDVHQFFSTGCTELDIRLSNRIDGGVPTRRITEFMGLEGSGKSLVSAHIIASAQKQGAAAILFDSEYAVSREFLQAVGVDVSKLVVNNPETVETMFESIETILGLIKADKKKSDAGVVIVIDSMSAIQTKADLEGNYDIEGYKTQKSRILSNAYQKILRMLAEMNVALVITNQYRMKMNPMPGEDKYNTSGGMATKYYATIRVSFSKAGTIKVGESIVGVKIQSKIVKSRLGASHGKCDFEVYFNRGIDNNGSLINALKKTGVIDAAGAWCTFLDSNGEEHRFQKKEFGELLQNNAKLAEEIYAKLADSLVTKYNTKEIPDAVTLDTTDDTEL